MFAIDAEERTFWSGIAASLAPVGNALECGHDPVRRFFALGMAPCPTCAAWQEARPAYAGGRERADAEEAQRIANLAMLLSAVDRDRERSEAAAHLAMLDPFASFGAATVREDRPMWDLEVTP